jgi:hypothetical protein
MVTPEEIATFAGKNGTYYARAWKRLSTPGATTGGFNGAAFFFNYGWMLYRRLYDMAAIFGALIVIEAVSSDWYFTHHPHLAEAQRSWDLLVRVMIAVTAGQFGNAWYLRRAARNIEYARGKGVDPTIYGGTNGWAVLIGMAAIFLGAALLFILVGIIDGLATAGN